MDFENIVYVVLAVIYFVSRVMKKRKQVPSEQSQEEPEPSQGRKPVSFEDLLKEFGVDKEQGEEKEVKETPLEKFEEIKEDVDEYGSRYSDEEAQSAYEQSVKEAGLLSEPEKKEDNRLVFEEFKPYQEEDDTNEVASEILELLEDEDGGKKAIILSEILNRRY